MDDKSNAVLQEIMDAGKAALHERHVKNAALEDAAIICELYAGSNECQMDRMQAKTARATSNIALKTEYEERATLCRKIAEAIRARKDFGPKPVTTSTPN
jgi:acyl-CoA reductase-like NAD-dependent aldehyde dehydrogenase